MINVEGYRAFHGTLRITPVMSKPPFELTGDFLYKPDTGCWYGLGKSFEEEVCEAIEEQPTADAVPVVHGRWVKPQRHVVTYQKCSVCGECFSLGTYKYCPDCAARMDGQEEPK